MKTDFERRKAAIARLVEKAGGWPWRYDFHPEDREFVFHLPAGASARGAGGAMQKLQELLAPKDIEILAGSHECGCAPRPPLRTLSTTVEKLAMRKVCAYITFIDVTWPWER